MSTADSFIECDDNCALFIPKEWEWTFQGKPTWGCAHKLQLFKMQEIQSKISKFTYYKDGNDSALAVYNTRG